VMVADNLGFDGKYFFPNQTPNYNMSMFESSCLYWDEENQTWTGHGCRVSKSYPKSISTPVKISHLVASLPTSRQQVVFALLVPSCQQVWNKLLVTCNNLVDIIRLVARLFQQVRYSHDITILLQPCVINLVTFLLYHDCIRLVRTTL
jgi:hypothetical protein